MAPTNGISVPTLSLPRGGGAVSGLGETQQPSPFAGGATLSVALPITSARGAEPQLVLGYDASAGNGPFGIGFSVAIPTITRRTNQHIPRYDDQDIFLLSGEENLVPVLEPSGAAWSVVVRREAGWRIVAYRPKVESDFPLIERWIDEAVTTTSYWQVTNRSNTVSVFGKDARNRIVDPGDPAKTFQWLLESTIDSVGNKVVYDYKQEDDAGLPAVGFGGRSTANRYPRSIRYGNYFASGIEAFPFELRFDYGEFDWQSYRDAQPWPLRADPFSTYRPGFELRTQRLCRGILMFHCFPVLNAGEPVLVRALRLGYDETAVMSSLTSIVEEGFRLRGDGGYDRQALPPLACSYSAFAPLGHDFRTLQVEAAGAMPGSLTEYTPVDLYGEGLPGFLVSNSSFTLYFRPEGNASYARPQAPLAFPVDRALGAEVSLQDLDGNSQLSLVVNDGPRKGYYRDRYDGQWGGFTPFASAPTALDDPSFAAIDLDGSGRAALLQVNAGAVTYYPSRGFHGYAAAQVVPVPSGFPAEASDPAEHVTYADLFGDGLSHRVRIRNGQVECWPDLGYGRFGNRVELGNAPRFPGGFEPARLVLADLDGAGPRDLIYILDDRLAIYLNQSGNGFADPIYLALPASYSSVDEIRFVDVLGNGTSALVFTKLDPVVTHYYYSFADGATMRDQTKPYLMVGYDNNIGAQTRFAYATSTWFYLEDRKQGRSWPTRLPFPVQVVAERTISDAISNTTSTTRYRYHDGYYDFRDRVFRGFGYVESWDAQTYEAFTERFIDQEISLDQINDALYAPPIYTRTWYHIGALGDSAAVERSYRSAYSHADPAFVPLPYLALDPRIDREDPRTMHVAYEALNGRVMHQEIYAVERDGSFGDPLSVTETNYYVQLVQPRGDHKYPVVAISQREQILYDYERTPADPRVRHDVTLEVDSYAQATLACTLAYARRPASRIGIAEQAALLATATRSGYINTTDGVRWLGVPAGTRRYELSELATGDASQVLTFAEIAARAGGALANVIAYGEPFTPGVRQARQFGWDRSYYYNADLSGTVPLDGPLPVRTLIHHQEAAVFTKAVIARAFDGRLTDDELIEQGGYSYDAATGYWWNRGLVAIYDPTPESFYALRETANAFVADGSPLDSRTTVGYDDYWLRPVRRTEILAAGVENVSTAALDYIAMAADRLVDINGNVSEVRFDPLAQVVLRTVYKPAGALPRQGDDPLSSYGPSEPATFDAVLGDPRGYLKQITSYYYYDLDAWRLRGQPVSALAIQRDTHVSDLVPPTESRLQIDLAYFDGALRPVEHKRKAGPGLAVLHDGGGRLTCDAGGAPRIEAVDERWVVSGRVVLNNKGAEAERYLPYYSDRPGYEDQSEVAALVPPPTITRYDALGRSIRAETPKGFTTAVEFSPWQTRRFDEDDTVTASPFYLDNYEKVGPDEKDALDKAAVFEDTPATELVDPMGNAVRTVAELVSDAGGPITRATLTTFHGFDIEGRQLVTVDPRLYAYDVEAGLPPDQWRVSFRHQYAMGGEVLQSTSADAGSRAAINNIYGKPIRLWDARGFAIAFTYDRLRRPTSITVIGNEGPSGLVLDNLVEQMVYGESQSDPEARNLRGQLYQHFDEAGVATFESYTFEGEIAQTERQLLADYRTEVDWRTNPALDADRYRFGFVYDALRRVIRETLPDGSVQIFGFLDDGWLGSIALLLDDGSQRSIIDSIAYDANGQRTQVAYGNGVVTSYSHEPTTLRLAAIASTRPGGAAIQAADYIYDPVGNITRTRDRTYEFVFQKPQSVDPVSDYTYDSLYRLALASGRQHTGIEETTYIDGFKQSIFADLGSVALEMYGDRFTYDDSGNLTERYHQASSTSWSRSQPPVDDSNRLAGVDYDAAGNTLSLALDQPAQVFWSVRNVMARVEHIVHADGVAATEYYAFDRRRERVRTVTIARLDDGSGGSETREVIRLGSYERVRVTRSTTGLDSERIAVLVRDDLHLVAIAEHWLTGGPGARSRALRYQLDNYLRSTAVELDDSAALLSFEEYDAYGGTSVIAGPDEPSVAPKTMRFSAKERLDTTTLYDYGLRFLAPWSGRWMSPDPSGAIDGLNLYAFVNGNPVTMTDRDGQCGDKPSHEPVPIQPTAIVTPVTTRKSFVDVSKTLAFSGALFNAFSELVESRLHSVSHAPLTVQNVIPKSVFLLSQSHVAASAFYGGLFGLIAPSVKIYGSLREGEKPKSKYIASLIGAGLFTREGYLVYKSLIPGLLKPPTVRQIGLTGGFADLFKAYYYYQEGETQKTITYSALSLANFRFAGLFPRLPHPAVFLAGALFSAIPLEFWKSQGRAIKEALTPEPPPVPSQHWTSSSNVLLTSLRTTTGYKKPKT